MKVLCSNCCNGYYNCCNRINQSQYKSKLEVFRAWSVHNRYNGSITIVTYYFETWFYCVQSIIVVTVIITVVTVVTTVVMD
jgi:hypothetical protein